MGERALWAPRAPRAILDTQYGPAWPVVAVCFEMHQSVHVHHYGELPMFAVLTHDGWRRTTAEVALEHEAEYARREDLKKTVCPAPL